MDFYDYIIIGAGPSGLTMAYTLGTLGKKCLILDSNDSIGGCHRVTRVNGLFTEHSPRIYSSSYCNTINLLHKMGTKFTDIFTPYNFSISNIGGKTINNLKWRELVWLFIDLIILLIYPCHGKTTSMKQYMHCKNFSCDSRDYVDRLCRFTDGAGIDRYSLYEFLSLFNQQILYTIYQPKLPNDKGLFKMWQDVMDKTGNIKTILSAQVVSVTEKDVVYTMADQPFKSSANRIILAIPPKALTTLLSSCPEPIHSSFGSFPDIQTWADKTSYIIDIPITFHWKSKLAIPQIWGFPKLEWGVVWIELSKYMDFTDDRSQTVFSVCATRIDTKSKTINKTANECNEQELIAEVFRQLHDSFLGYDLPKADFSIIYPKVKKIGDKWIDEDSAYMASSGTVDLPAFSKTIPTLYNLGTQNGQSYYAFTSFESAVTNALALLHVLEPEGKRKYPIIILQKFTDIIRTIICLCIIAIILFIIYKYVNNKSNHT